MQRREMVEECTQTSCPVPFYYVEARNAILPSYGVQVTAKHGHSHAGAAGAGGGHVAAPLVGFRIVSGTGRNGFKTLGNAEAREQKETLTSPQS